MNEKFMLLALKASIFFNSNNIKISLNIEKYFDEAILVFK
jgi:hypothetical protein